MNTASQKHVPLLRCVFAAYISSVTITALCFTIFSIGFGIITKGFESATTNSLETKMQHLLILFLILFVIGWFFTIITATIPFIAGEVVARKFGLYRAKFFITFSTVTAIFISPLCALIPSLGINAQVEEPSLIQKIIYIAPFFAIYGAIAGIVYWKIISLNLDTKDSNFNKAL